MELLSITGFMGHEMGRAGMTCTHAAFHCLYNLCLNEECKLTWQSSGGQENRVRGNESSVNMKSKTLLMNHTLNLKKRIVNAIFCLPE